MMELVYTAVEEISLGDDSGYRVRIEIKNIKHSQKEFIQEQIQLAFKEIEKKLFE